MSVKLETAYRQELHNALEKCQFIEETLRMCITHAVDIARIQLSSHFPVKFKKEDISKLPMGALVAVFSKINDDKTLHNSLRKITKERNEVAHRSLLFTLGELSDKEHMTEVTLKMKGITERATEVHNNLHDVRCALLKSLNKVKRSKNSAG
jgi:hypothetical protein